MKHSLHTFVATASLILASLPAIAQDAQQQRFVFIADDAMDSPAAYPSQAAKLVGKVVAHAQKAGFNYGDTIELATVPGGSALWDEEVDILRARNTHPQQLGGFLTRRLAELGQGALRARSQIVWAMDAVDAGCDGPTPTFVYVFTNGISALDIQGDNVSGSGTSAGALQGCSIHYVGLGLNNADGLSLTAKMRVDEIFSQISANAGGTHDIIR